MLTIYYAAITSLALCLVAWTEFGRRAPDFSRILFAYWVGLYWIAGEIARHNFPLDTIFRLEPAVDAAVALIVLGSLARRPAWWKAAIVLFLIAQLTAHLAYWAQEPPRARALYRLAVNVLYHGILLSMVAPGVADGIRRASRRYRRPGPHFGLAWRRVDPSSTGR